MDRLLSYNRDYNCIPIDDGNSQYNAVVLFLDTNVHGVQVHYQSDLLPRALAGTRLRD